MVCPNEQHQVENRLQQQHGLEAEMVGRDKYGAIRELHGRGVPKKEIARQLGVTVKTVRNWLNKPKWEPYERPRSQKTVFAGFESWLASRAPEVNFNASILFRELKLSGYRGGYEMVKLFVRPLRNEHRQQSQVTARFETAPGKQAQVDWGSASVWVGEHPVRIHFFAMVLGYSRRLFVRAYPNERLSMLLQGHTEAFSWFGGCTGELLYDNPRTIVANGVLQPSFADFAAHYGFTPRLCWPYRPQTKGKIESGVKYIKRNFLPGRRFQDLDHLNRELERWLVEVADTRIHGTTGCRPIERFREERLLDLISVPPYRLETAINRQVARDSMISFGGNRYSVPWRFAGRSVQVETWGEELRILCEGQIIATHAKLSGSGGCQSDPAHYQGLFRNPAERKAQEPPRFDPWWKEEDVGIRDLSIYDRVANL
jgi:transposase